MPRLFVAIRPPEEVLDLLIDTMEGIETARWQDEEQMHITLAFIGQVEEHMAADIDLALSQLPFAPFELSLERVGYFEHRGRVHSAWAGVERHPELLALQGRVERACRALVPGMEHRRYHPHVTLARFSRPAPELPHWLARHDGLRAGPFTVESFALFESRLTHGPAIYEELARYPG